MLNAFNNHFEHKYKIKIPKIRPFFNLKDAKLLKTCVILFENRFLKVRHAQNKKNIDASNDCI